MMKYLKNFRLLFLIFFVSKTVFANQNDVYFINSMANSFTEIDQSSLKNYLDMKNTRKIAKMGKKENQTSIIQFVGM